MKKKNMEDMFKDSFENFEADVSPGVWKNIQTALKGVGIGLLVKSLINKIGTNTIVAVVSSAAAIISTVVLMNWNNKPATKPVAETKTSPKTVVEKPKPLAAEEIKAFLTDNKDKETVSSEIQQKNENVKEKAASSGTYAIKKDKMNEVIKEYSSLPVASISANPVGGTVPLVVNISNSGTGKINKWNFGDNKKETGNNPLHVYDTPGIYTITLTSTGEDGKTAYDSIKVEVFGNSSIPSAPREFTPNDDGKMDTFSFRAENMVSMNVTVFDKNGTVYYKSDNLDAKWDGTDVKGQKAKEGLYFFIQTAEGVDGKKYEQKGSISLIR
jgi:gliding motility-associated-like protein